MQKRKVFIVAGNQQYSDLFLGFGMTITEHLNEAHLVVFTGGEDVTPGMYGAKAHPSTYNSIRRDEYESAIFEHCKLAGIPMVGICRGGQFLNVMNGGAMYQNVSRHTNDHVIIDSTTNERVFATSTHHQMMKPSSKGILVVFSGLGGNRQWYEGQDYYEDMSDLDIEVVFYPETCCLCFQPHPEFGEQPLKDYFLSLLTRYNLLT